MNQEQFNISLGNTIGHLVTNCRPELLAFLSRNMVIVPDRVSDEKLIDITVNALSDKNNNFVAENFLTFVGSKISAESGYSNASGDWISGAAGLISSGIGAFGSIKSSEAAGNAIKDQARANLGIAQLNQQTALAMIEAERLKSQNTVPAKDNTLLYVILGIGGIAVFGFTIYMVTKK